MNSNNYNPSSPTEGLRRELLATVREELGALAVVGELTFVTTMQRTQWALDLFRSFIESWAPPAMHEHLIDDDNNSGERVRSAIRAIAPETDEARLVGWSQQVGADWTDADFEDFDPASGDAAARATVRELVLGL